MTESTTRKPRKREPKDKPTKWMIGPYEIDVENGVYRITHGPHLLVRTTDAQYFKDYCALLEKSVK